MPIAERLGGVIVADNVVRHAAVADVNSRDEQVQGVRTFRDMVTDDPRLGATGVQTVGSKGWDSSPSRSARAPTLQRSATARRLSAADCRRGIFHREDLQSRKSQPDLPMTLVAVECGDQAGSG
ncbi:hypothetical protein [Geodermatophilus africanus]|uniref:hypothetical protein n=1 Tax=Geodermatophilus africanus TaxID=1137993 RepID=UPI001B8C879A|nr:hypothetical protein [Geodermatophilus africanus]